MAMALSSHERRSSHQGHGKSRKSLEFDLARPGNLEFAME